MYPASFYEFSVVNLFDKLSIFVILKEAKITNSLHACTCNYLRAMNLVHSQEYVLSSLIVESAVHCKIAEKQMKKSKALVLNFMYT